MPLTGAAGVLGVFTGVLGVSGLVGVAGFVDVSCVFSGVLPLGCGHPKKQSNNATIRITDAAFKNFFILPSNEKQFYKKNRESC